VQRSKRWLVPLTGAAFIVLGIIGFVVGGEPTHADHPPRDIANWYLDNKDSIEIGAFIAVAAVVLLVFFGAYLRTALVLVISILQAVRERSTPVSTPEPV
jgi:hypothetical protein